MEEEDPTARVTFEPEGGDQEAERGGRVGHPISAKASIRGAAHAAQATAPAAPPAATAEELLAENLQQRLAAMFLARQGRAPLPSGSGSSIPSPAVGLRVVGLSFIGLLGLDPGLCWMEVCIARPRTRPASAPARLHAIFPGPCRSYPPPPQPWPPSGVHFHRSDPPFGRSCIVSTLCVQLSCGASSDRFGHQGSCQGGRSSAGDGRSVGGGGGGGLAVRMAGGGRARARSGLSGGLLMPQPSSSRSSSRGGGGLKKAPLATWEAATTRAQLGSRGNRPEASWGGVERVFGDRSSACQFS